uniref:E3 ubiquitin-protein ligase RNF170 (Trinotate prediction) n=1 Tax=Henneguya salminicola TaxID=69463 RepID=A0A6G3MI33_HENSL
MLSIFKLFYNRQIFDWIGNPSVLATTILVIVSLIFLFWVINILTKPTYYDIVETDQRDTRRINGDEMCAICQEALNQIHIQTNCNHPFCGVCFLSLMNFTDPTTPPPCPVCRQKVISLKQKWDSTLELKENDKIVAEFLSRFNRKFGSESRTFYEWVQDAPEISRHIIQEVISPHGHLYLHNLRCISFISFTFVYLIFPINFLPHIWYNITGLLYDMVVLVVVLLQIIINIRNRQRQ